MLLFRSDPFGGTHELLSCGLYGGDLVELFRKSNSKYYSYDFTVRGERYRGSTKETNETRAQKAAALKLAAAIKGSDPLDRKHRGVLPGSGPNTIGLDRLGPLTVTAAVSGPNPVHYL